MIKCSKFFPYPTPAYSEQSNPQHQSYSIVTSKGSWFIRKHLWSSLGYWHQRTEERHDTPPPQGIQQLSAVKDKVVSLGSMECDIFPSVLWHCWLGDRKGIRPVKNWVLVCRWWRIDWSFARLIAPVVTTTSIMLCFNKQWLTKVTWQMAISNGERDLWSLSISCLFY